jgi:hypothetical protein
MRLALFARGRGIASENEGSDLDREELVRALIHLTAAGRLDARRLEPALQVLTGKPSAPVSSGAVLGALEGLDVPALRELAGQLRESRRKDALAFYQLKTRGQPVPEDLRTNLDDLPLDAPSGWRARPSAQNRIHNTLHVLADRLFLASRREKAPNLSAVMEKKYQEFREAAFRDVGPWENSTLLQMISEVERESVAGHLDLSSILPEIKASVERKRRQAVEAADRALSRPEEPLLFEADAETFLSALSARFAKSQDSAERRRLLDVACQWPTDGASPFLLDLVQEPWAQERASLILTLRFGQPSHVTWEHWRTWLRIQAGGKGLGAEGSRILARKRPLAMLYLWYSRQEDAAPKVLADLESLVADRLEPVTMDAFVERWARSLSPEEVQALTGFAPPARIVEVPRAVQPLPAVRIEPPAPRPAPKPSVWEIHLKPFFLENWYMVAGVAMVLVGSSLLGYYTWDKHWLIRYTLMPSLLGVFTAALAWMGGWIERKDAQFKGTGAVLRGAAIGLLPVNFMAVALLANDPQVTGKTLAVPLMGVLYLSLFGWGLRRWSSAVHPSLGFTLGGSLLFLNSLVMLAPLTGLVAAVKHEQLLPVVGTGFYLGFLALAAAVVRFARKILTLELAKEKRVVWFFGAALAGTFVQVFAWVHGYLRHLPNVHTYAPMMVLTGGLVLYLERRTLELQRESEKHGAESFLGFAFILFGVLMGIGHPAVRILTFSLAGLVWIVQSLPRRQPLHHWIGLTLAALGGASVGLLPAFPAAWLPTLDIALALGLGVVVLLSRSAPELSRSAAGMQAAVLMLTVLVTVLAQLHFGSSRAGAAAHLAAISGLFGIRAWRDRKIRWVQSGMVVLALALPYVVGVDLGRDLFHSTTLVFGLAVLSFAWIAATVAVKTPLLSGARSTVLWIFGVLAIACMAVRSTLDPHAMQDSPWFDFGGPLLMTLALVAAAWFSRSLIPAGMAMLIALILTPEMKERLQLAYPQLGWGTGFGSSLTALGLTFGSFLLRRSPALQKLGAGDKYMGEVDYPLRRLDHTLFTWPMIASALFLALKVEFWNTGLHISSGNNSLKLAIALFVSGIVWTLLAVYGRSHRPAPGATYLGLFWMIVGIVAGLSEALPGRDAGLLTLIPGLFIQSLYFGFRFVVQPRHPWAADLLTRRTQGLLKLGSLLLALPVVVAGGMGADPHGSFGPLSAFVAAQLAWHGLTSRRWIYGIALFAVNWISLLAWSAKGGISISTTSSLLDATIGMTIGIQLLQAGLEFRKSFYEYLKPLMQPFQILGTLLTLGLGLLALSQGFGHGLGLTRVAVGGILVSVLLNARALSSGPLALLSALIGQVLLLPPEGDLSAFASPARLSFLAFTVAVLGHAGGRIAAIHPRLLSGAFTPRSMRWPVRPWMFLPAALFACIATILHTFDPVFRESAEQVWAPFGSAAAIGVVASSTGQLSLYLGSGALMTFGNVHLVRIVLGAFLRNHGVGEMHLVAMGIALTLLQGTLIRILARREELSRLIRQAGLAWAGLILGVISANYLVHPNLQAIGPLRFALSGAMSFLAGWYFRRAARQPAPGQEPFVQACEGLYHFGVTMALWCAALMIPVLRHPVTALVSLGLPVIYFYARAESGFRREVETFVRYRTSAATLGFVVLALYAVRGVVQIVIFPEIPFDTGSYHANSPVIVALGLVLLRLHALGGTWWLAFYGGLATMAGAYFAVTAFPGWSPFAHPVASAWAAIAMAHFFTMASIQQSPLRSWIQRLAAIDPQAWQSLRRPWGLCLLVAAHALALWGILDYPHQPRMVAPLLIGAASLLIHQGVLRGSRVYTLIAQAEIAVALHMGFVVQSYLAPQHVVWALLGLWAAMIGVQAVLARAGMGWDLGAHALGFAGLTLAHVFYHHPGSAAGLWAFALGAVLFSLSPRSSRAPHAGMEVVSAGVLPIVPAWLVFFSQAPLAQRGIAGAVEAWPALATAGTLLATGAVALFLKNGGSSHYLGATKLRPRMVDQTISLLGATGGTQYRAVLATLFPVILLVQLLHWGKKFDAREMVLLEALDAALAVAWLFEGKARKAAWPYFLMELAALAAFVGVRQQIGLTWGNWRFEYDVWASLAVFFGLVGARQLLEDQSRELLIPLKSTLLALPVFSVTWVALHHLGTDLGLLVVGLHSAAFAYMGREDRESPYHLVAVGGFVAFVILLFWSKLDLKVVYAYVLPVGVGVLVLLQLFKAKVSAEARNGIRAVTILSMLGSAGWSALVHSRIPVGHNLVLLALCLGAMAIGGLLQIRMYVALGFGALMVDLLALMVKMVGLMERSLRMSVVGSVVLLVGAGLVFGAIYYKTHRKEVAALLERWRLRFAGWE